MEMNVACYSQWATLKKADSSVLPLQFCRRKVSLAPSPLVAVDVNDGGDGGCIHGVRLMPEARPQRSPGERGDRRDRHLLPSFGRCVRGLWLAAQPVARQHVWTGGSPAIAGYGQGARPWLPDSGGFSKAYCGLEGGSLTHCDLRLRNNVCEIFPQQHARSHAHTHSRRGSPALDNVTR